MAFDVFKVICTGRVKTPHPPCNSCDGEHYKPNSVSSPSQVIHDKTTGCMCYRYDCASEVCQCNIHNPHLPRFRHICIYTASEKPTPENRDLHCCSNGKFCGSRIITLRSFPRLGKRSAARDRTRIGALIHRLSCVVLVAFIKGSRGAPSKIRAGSHGTGYDFLRISPYCRRPAHIRPSPAAHQGAETEAADHGSRALGVS